MTQAMNQLGSGMEHALTIDPDAFAKAIHMNMSEDELSELLMSLMTYENASCDGNLKKLGYADEAVRAESRSIRRILRARKRWCGFWTNTMQGWRHPVKRSR